MTTYTAVVTEWAHGLEVSIEGVGVTQADTLDEVEEMARDYIALDLDVPPDSFEVRVVGPAVHARPAVTGSGGNVLVPSSVPIEDLEEWKRHIWFTPELTVAERQLLIMMVLWSRGKVESKELDEAMLKARSTA